MRRRRPKALCCLASVCDPSDTLTGRSCRSRSNWRMWRGVSPSRTPLRSRPLGSRAVYSNAPMAERLVLARDAQDFLHGGLAAQNLRAPIVPNRRGHRARIALELMLRRAVMDHGAHLFI